MKKTFVILAMSCFCGAGFAALLPLADLGSPLPGTNLNVIWNAPTNDLPASLWVYRVLPAEFSPMVISNLMELGNFTSTDKTNILGRAFSDPNARFFTKPDGARHLTILPQFGYIEYRDETADDMKITEGVPKDTSETLQLATNLLVKLGLQRSELATKPGSSEFQNYFSLAEATLYQDLTGPAYATNIHMRGVFFIRKVDGVDFMGKGLRGGCEISFGHHAKVYKILLVWRKLEREKLHPLVSVETILRWIREGKAVWDAPPGIEYLDWASIKSVTITKLLPHYYGADRRVLQQWAYPFATLETIVDTGTTQLLVYLYCPIIDMDETQAPR